MKKSSGFTLVEGLLVVLVLSVIGFAGYFVWSNQDKSENVVTETNTPVEPTESTEDNDIEELILNKEFTAYGVTVSFAEPEGWSSNGLYGYPGELSNEYIIYIDNIAKDIRLTLQISDFKDSLYEQNVKEEFVGINGDSYYITYSIDDEPGDDIYQQLGISKCNNGHCLTKINENYNLNANITPIDSNTSFNGSEANLEEIKQIFSSIVFESIN
jgi:hypothetical protein